MNIILFGYGKVGIPLTKLLLEEESVRSIVCADIKFSKKISHKKISYKKVDASNMSSLTDFFKTTQADLIVNASLPHFNLNLLQCAVSQKAHYLDLASYWDIDRSPYARSPYKIEQLGYHEKFQRHNLRGLINAGVSPGLTNLLARECADVLDSTKSIKIRLVEYTGNDELYFAWSKDWILDEMSWKPLVYKNGKFVIENNFAGEEIFEFPPPFGAQKVYLLAQDEVGTIPLYIPVKNVDIKSYDDQIEAMKILVKLGLLSEQKVTMNGISMKPKEFFSKVLPDSSPIYKNEKFKNAVFGFVVEAKGKKDNEDRTVRYTAIFPRQKQIDDLDPDANFISYPTALMTKLFIMAISKIHEYGLFPPEALSAGIRKFILEQLKKYPVKITKNF